MKFACNDIYTCLMYFFHSLFLAESEHPYDLKQNIFIIQNILECNAKT